MESTEIRQLQRGGQLHQSRQTQLSRQQLTREPKGRSERRTSRPAARSSPAERQADCRIDSDTSSPNKHYRIAASCESSLKRSIKHSA